MKIKIVTVFGICLLTAGCSGTVGDPIDPVRPDLAHEGIAPHVWEEPMVDVVEVPPGLDPEGHYYRPAHQSVVEIRQGKWQYYKNKDSDK